MCSRGEELCGESEWVVKHLRSVLDEKSAVALEETGWHNILALLLMVHP
jgi:hypothetical protein